MPYFGEVAALITALFWSVTSIAFAEATKRVGPIYVNVTRMFLALSYLLLVLLIINLKIDLSSRQVFYLALSAFSGLVIGDTFLFKAFGAIGARLSMLIMALVPPISAFTAYFFLEEKISIVGILGIVVTVSGIALVIVKREEKSSSNEGIDYAGIFYAVIGAAGQAVGLVLAKYAFNESEINGFLATFIRIAFALMIIFPLSLMTRHYKAPVKLFLKDRKAFVFTVIGSIFGPFLGITFSLISISNTKIGIASTLMATVPVIMLPLIHFYYKEKLSWISIVGTLVAVSGVAILFLH
jgi:drug/metabolite transporter (DMT)-like permease